MAKYEVDEDVIVHTRDGRGRNNAEYSGKIIAVARVYTTIKYTYDNGRTTTAQFSMETGRLRNNNGYTTELDPWFETPQEKEVRIAVEQAIEVLKAYGFELTRFRRATDAEVLGVAKFLKDNFPKEE